MMISVSNHFQYNCTFLISVPSNNNVEYSEESEESENSEGSKGSKLKGAFLVLTNRCNLQCKYCYQNSSPSIDVSDELTKSEWLSIIDELKRLGATEINMVGGEPIARPDFWEMLDYAADKGFKIKIFTNGLLLTPESIKKLKGYAQLSLSFNLNSYEKEMQEFYQGAATWDTLIAVMQECRKQGLEFEVSTPVTGKTYGGLDKYIKFCAELGAKRIRLLPLILMGRAQPLKNDSLSETQVISLKEKVEAWNKKRNANKKKDTKGNTNRNTKKNEERNEIEITVGCRTCEGGVNYLTIQPNGDVTPCSLIRDKIFGNIKANSLKEIMGNSYSIEYRKLRKKQKYTCLTGLAAEI